MKFLGLAMIDLIIVKIFPNVNLLLVTGLIFITTSFQISFLLYVDTLISSFEFSFCYLFYV